MKWTYILMYWHCRIDFFFKCTIENNVNINVIIIKNNVKNKSNGIWFFQNFQSRFDEGASFYIQGP